jgi:hypothetical protein
MPNTKFKLIIQGQIQQYYQYLLHVNIMVRTGLLDGCSSRLSIAFIIL